jgi:hypothetical protein
MSKLVGRAVPFIAVAAIAAGVIGAAGAGASGTLGVTANSSSAATVSSAKVIKATVTTAGGSAVVTAFVKAAGQPTVATTPKTTSGGSVSLSLTTTGKALVKQCGTISYTVRATSGASTVSSDGTLSASASCAPFNPAAGVNTIDSDRCDFIAGGAGKCLVPYPNNAFTKADNSTPTGIRVNISRDSMPANAQGVHIDPAEWNRDDGFSPDPKVMVSVPGFLPTGPYPATTAGYAQWDTDIAKAASNTGWPTVGTIGKYADANSPLLLVDKATGARVPVWAELDSQVSRSIRPLLIHPAQNLLEGHTYVVGLRGFKTYRNRLVAPSPNFLLYRDSKITNRSVVEGRRQAFEDDFTALVRAGASRSKLQLAWEFTVGSRQSLTRRMLAIRDNAFSQLGDTNLADLVPQGSSPKFEITSVTTDPSQLNSHVARRVEGTITVPCYLTSVDGVPCAPGSTFNYGSDTSPDATPVQNGTYKAEFRCEIPKAAFSDRSNGGNAVALPPVIYGHGLLGGRGEIGSDAQVDFADQYGYVYCATNEIGFASEDVPTAQAALGDLSKFKQMADRTQQGLLNELFLGRALVTADGLRSDASFQGADSKSLLSGSRLFYDGNSQGGILGGALTAIAPDFNHAVLGVNGMTYSTLLDRSVDFLTYLAIAYAPGYPDAYNRSLGIALIQQIWDRAEPGGYALHMTTNPLPNTPQHQVLMQVGVGDFQVSNITADAEARTVGAKIMTPIVAAGRGGLTNPGWGLSAIPSYPYNGSALVYFDAGPVRSDGAGGWLGNSPAPFANVTAKKASGSSANDGADPHERPRRSSSGRAMKSAFLRVDGSVTQTCGSNPCNAEPWTGQ